MNDTLLWLLSGHHAAAIAGALSLCCFAAAWQLIHSADAVPSRR
jgi:hypothetical protein